jgi:hypothetical protein
MHHQLQSQHGQQQTAKEMVSAGLSDTGALRARFQPANTRVS